MALSDHLKPGLAGKTRARILTVDPATRTVQAGLKDGSSATVAVWDEVGNAFRWPKENEIWIIRRDTGVWVLDCRAQSAQVSDVTVVDLVASTTAEHEPAPIESMAPGEMKLDASTVINADGLTFVAVDLTGIANGWTLKWDATLKRFVAGP